MGDESYKGVGVLLGNLARLGIFVGSVSMNACTAAATASPETAFVGSTPGGAEIKSMLGIDQTRPVDFIRWHLVLRETQKRFVMTARYGVGKPNTPDFEGGGEKRAFEGTYAVAKDGPREIYTLTSSNMGRPVSLVSLNDDLFHVLTADKRLMVGNGGWSFSLSRQGVSATRLPARAAFEGPMRTATQVVFDGRTPCREIAKEYNWNVDGECFKLKWRLTLFRDPKSGKPTTYTIQRTLHRTEPIEGTWTTVTGTKTDPKAVVYRLDPDKPERSMSFLVADENVLFFLDREGRLFGGNADFSYTLNRRMD
jgi:hypothetical protein